MIRLVKNEKGFTLIEVVIAIALLGIIASGFLMALSGATKAILVADERTTAESLARSQMEYVKNQTYDDTNNPPQYSQLPSIPTDYTIALTAERLDPEGDGTGDDDGLQKITVTISHNTKQIITLEEYKGNR